MVSLKPRNRLVNFRLTEEEYGKLAAVCAQKGSPSISDFTRAAILRTVELESRSEGALDARMTSLDARVAELEQELRQLVASYARRGRGFRTDGQSAV
jgi:hypothetical protein